MQIIIDAPHFYVMADLDAGRFPPIINYMKGWTIEEIRDYCEKKKWKLTEIGEKPPVWSYDYYNC